ncbi:hypothetical protein A9267_19235 [Shewanella sp. UCD-FRSSP16_17]|uniref:hypothetical protein n=1 Tax=unclassified Shewanella TaxID=196818 RepID=UPI0006D66CE0|nr:MULTISPECIES: hypothetical protein [unclassified Shewanella]KPZ68131.1 hypothetical protein AN944_03711 [Shewanella sp. P1-14-1]MBQ4892118.1 hypothetical protein [Shewanella sp. MMG014]OBT03732.1 hypothetical protein A9267_19235 [Shewanella sp. UCD-FRSSP16_17]
MSEEQTTLARPLHGFNSPQRYFVGYTLAVLVDLTVLNLLDEFWQHINVSSFSISLLVAILLQLLLKLTIAFEHKLADYFKSKPGTAPKIYRALSTWAILFFSKIIMLEAINLAFGDAITFTGPVDGLVAFFVLVFGILIAEFIVSKIYFSLRDKPSDNESETTA